MGNSLFRVRSVTRTPKVSEKMEGCWTRLDHVLEDRMIIIGEQTVTEFGS